MKLEHAFYDVLEGIRLIPISPTYPVPGSDLRIVITDETDTLELAVIDSLIGKDFFDLLNLNFFLGLCLVKLGINVQNHKNLKLYLYSDYTTLRYKLELNTETSQ